MYSLQRSPRHTDFTVHSFRMSFFDAYFFLSQDFTCISCKYSFIDFIYFYVVLFFLFLRWEWFPIESFCENLKGC